MAHWWGGEDTFYFWGATFVILLGLFVSSERVSVAQAVLQLGMQQHPPLSSAAYPFAGIRGTGHQIRHFLFALLSMLPVSPRTMNAIGRQIAKCSIAALLIMTGNLLPLVKGRQHPCNSDLTGRFNSRSTIPYSESLEPDGFQHAKYIVFQKMMYSVAQVAWRHCRFWN